MTVCSWKSSTLVVNPSGYRSCSVRQRWFVFYLRGRRTGELEPKPITLSVGWQLSSRVRLKLFHLSALLPLAKPQQWTFFVGIALNALPLCTSKHKRKCGFVWPVHNFCVLWSIKTLLSRNRLRIFVLNFVSKRVTLCFLILILANIVYYNNLPTNSLKIH